MSPEPTQPFSSYASDGARAAQTIERRVLNPKVEGMVGRTRTSPRQAPLQTVNTQNVSLRGRHHRA